MQIHTFAEVISPEIDNALYRAIIENLQTLGTPVKAEFPEEIPGPAAKIAAIFPQFYCVTTSAPAAEQIPADAPTDPQNATGKNAPYRYVVVLEGQKFSVETAATLGDLPLICLIDTQKHPQEAAQAENWATRYAWQVLVCEKDGRWTLHQKAHTPCTLPTFAQIKTASNTGANSETETTITTGVTSETGGFANWAGFVAGFLNALSAGLDIERAALFAQYITAGMGDFPSGLLP